MASTDALRHVRGPGEIRPIDGNAWSVRVTLDAASKAELELLQNLLSHKCGRDVTAVLREAVRCGIEKHGKRRGAVPTRRVNRHAPEDIDDPADSGRESSRRAVIPAPVKQAVYERDRDCCSFVAADGRRCGSRWKLEFDHVHAAFLDGPATVENVQLVGAHNVHNAEQVFGREHMDKFRRRN